MVNFLNISIGDKRYFHIERGERIRKEDIIKAEGSIPVYSGSKESNDAMGFVSDKIKEIVPKAKKFNGRYITINANGSVGQVFIRNGEFYLHDDVNAVEVLDKKIVLDYLHYELQNKISVLGYDWSKKLYKQELEQEISIDIPIKENGEFDVEKQNEIANKYIKIEDVKRKLKADYERISNIAVDIFSKYETRAVLITELFELKKGNAKYTKRYIHDHWGDYPVYSSQTSRFGEIGKIDSYDYNEECFTWTTDGVNAGTVFYRNGKFSITTHCGILKIRGKYRNSVIPEFLNFVLNQTLPKNSVGEWANKRVGVERLGEISIDIPIKENGEFDVEKQNEIANKYIKIEDVKRRLKDDYLRVINAKIQISEN